MVGYWTVTCTSLLCGKYITVGCTGVPSLTVITASSISAIETILNESRIGRPDGAIAILHHRPYGVFVIHRHELDFRAVLHDDNITRTHFAPAFDLFHE